MTDSLLLAAVKQRDFKAVTERLDEGDDVDGDKDDMAPLWHAANYNYSRIAALLIDHGADLSRQFNGKTPLQAANTNDDKTTFELLRNASQKPRKPFEAEKWVAMGPDSVALVGRYPALGRRLTHIFNFEMRERLLISENLKTSVENVADRTPFDALPPQALGRALDEFERLGGKPDREYVLEGQNTLGKTRKMPGPEAGHG